MYVFYALVIVGLILLWLFLSKFFIKIGQAAEQFTEKFNENEGELNNGGGKENEN